MNLTERIETTILSSLIHNEEYTRKVIPFIKPEYFQDGVEKVIFQTIEKYTNKYKSNPNIETLIIDLQKVSLNDEQYKASLEYVLFPAFEINKIDTVVPSQHYDVIIFISVNAVIYSEEYFSQLFVEPLKVFAVGPITAKS